MSVMFLTNKLSGLDVQKMALLACKAGAEGLDTLAKTGNHGRAQRNVARDLHRATTRNTKVPEPYMAVIPLGDARTGQQIHLEHPVLLPHEMLEFLITSGTANLRDLVDVESRTDQTLHQRHLDFCAEHDLDPKKCIAIGFHGDGVPYKKATHKQASTEVLSWNLLCDLDGKRYMFTSVHHEFLCSCGCRGRCTFDALLEIFVWSMSILFGGLNPTRRHDQAPLDDKRSWKAGRPLGFHGVLLQARGDWAWFNQVFNFPHWNAKALCWRCKATQGGNLAYNKCGPTAPWRSTRLAPGAYLDHQVSNQMNPSPLFACPGFSIEQVSIGALHCMDLGVTQDVLGNIFWEALHNLGLPGRSIKDRCKALWQKLQRYYKDNKSSNRFQDLTVPMVRKDYKSTPKLKAKGGETRALLGFGVLLAQELHGLHDSVHTKMVLDLMMDLQGIYKLMYKDFVPQEAARLSTQVAYTYTKLEDEAKRANKMAWRTKPKLHMMQELLEYQSFELGNPRGFWEYQDEDFVGLIATLAIRRGGPATPTACSKGVMSRYRALLGLGEI